MNLLTKKLREQLPKIGATENLGAENTPIIVKWFTPDSSYTWYVTEYDGNDTCFGFVRGHANELGFFSLSEIEKIRGNLGLPVERDTSFGKHMLSEAMEHQPL